jgi:hypothetical protein
LAPSPIQFQATPPVLGGRDLCGIAPARPPPLRCQSSSASLPFHNGPRDLKGRGLVAIGAAGWRGLPKLEIAIVDVFGDMKTRDQDCRIRFK